MNLVIFQPQMMKYDLSFFNKLSSVSEIKSLEIFIISRNPNEENIAHLSQNIKVSRLDSSLLKNFMSIIKKILSKNNGEIFIFNGNPRDFLQVLAMVLSRLLNRKVISWGMFHPVKHHGVYVKYVFRLYALIPMKIFTYSDRGKQYLINIGVNEKKIFRIGTAISDFNQNVRENLKESFDKESFLNQYKLNNKKIILQVVTLNDFKRTDTLIDAISILKTITSVDFHLVLIGAGQVKSLKEQINKLDISEHVSFLGPIYDESELRSWFFSASVFTIASCIGLSAHHAFSYGIPVVTSNSLKYQSSEFEIIMDRYNSLLYNHDDPYDYASKLDILINDENYGTLLGKRGMDIIKNFSSESNKISNIISGLKK